MGFQEDCRAAAITTLDAVAAAQSVKLSTYPGRPASIHLPHAFVDLLRDTIEYVGAQMKMTVQVDIVILWGLFDSAVAVAQKDAFVDAYMSYLRDVPDMAAAGPNTLFAVVSTEDDPTFVPDWLGRENGGGRPYYATRITVEGFAGI